MYTKKGGFMKWYKMPELKDLVEQLMKTEEFKQKLAHIVPDRILYANFSKKESEIKGKIGQVPPRFAIFLEDFDYFLEVNQENWLESNEGQKLYIILHELFHIPVEGFDKESKQYKKTIKHDLEDFRALVREFGVDCENADNLVKLVG